MKEYRMAFVDWIKLEHTTPNKSEISRIAEILNIDPDMVLGKCIRVWIWADQNSVDGNTNVTLPASLDRYANCAGFGDALVKVGWAEIVDGTVWIKNFDTHNSESAKKRAQTLKRVRNHRGAVKRDCNAMSVTNTVTLSTSTSIEEDKSTLTESKSQEEGEAERAGVRGVGEGDYKANQDHFAGRPPASLLKPDYTPDDPFADFGGEVAAQAKLCYEKYHFRRYGGLPSYSDERVVRDCREIASAIEAYGEVANARLLKYLSEPQPKGHTRTIKLWQVLRYLALEAGDKVAPPAEVVEKTEEDAFYEQLKRRREKDEKRKRGET